MKSLTLRGLLLASGIVTALPSDQHGSVKAAAIKPFILKKLEPQYNSNATRALYMYGPFKLPPSNAKHGGLGFGLSGIKLDPNSDTPGGNIEPPCKDCTVHRGMANFAYKDSKPADVASGVYIHHIIIVDFSGKSMPMPLLQPPRCPKGGVLSPVPWMNSAKGGSGSSTAHSGAAAHSIRKRQLGGVSVFLGGGGAMGSGNPFSPRPGSNMKSGYWIAPGGNMALTSEIVNYDAVEKDLYLTLDLEWSPGRDPEMLDVGMGALSADGCNDTDKGFRYPPKDKPITYTGEEWVVSSDGFLVNFTPHLHDGGVNIKVLVNGREVCEAKAVYGAEGGTAKALDGKSWQTITEYTPCEGPYQVKKGDRVSMSSVYDLTKYRLRPDNSHTDMEAEGMALANYIYAKPFPKSSSGWQWGLS